MKLTRIVLASLTLLAATSAIALAQQDDSHWIEQRVAKRVISRIEARLNATPSQREQAKAILKIEQPIIVSLQQRARQEREELSQIPAFDDTRVRDIAQKYSTTNTDILVERVKVRNQLRAILTDAQRQQLDGMRATVGTHFEQRFNTFIDAI